MLDRRDLRRSTDRLLVGVEMIDALVSMIEGSAINNMILSSQWLWPSLEIVHFIGLSLLLGSMLVVDLRLAGLLRQIDIRSIHSMLPWASLGFLLNLVSGTLFLLGDPARYAVNIGFQLKMILVLIAGLNAIWFIWKLNPQIVDWEPHADTPSAAKAVAIVSLGAWFGVLLLGRLIPYIGSG
ncbi:MAG: hypothetical protein ACI88G_000513 [Woeseiaceae bacterium]|jgi:hypothetical protein